MEKRSEKIELRKVGTILLLVMMAVMVAVPFVSAENATLSKNPKIKKIVSDLPSKKTISQLDLPKEYLEYLNAPAISPENKDQAAAICTNSTGFSKFRDLTHGQISVVWAYPYTGKQRISTVVGSSASDTYGLYYAYVNPEDGSILDEGFLNWKKYW
ncbi:MULTISPECIES: hypothetical protein [unclassified Methanoregula]|uniref:hypothetical protein n=1 Tax=unclassified Methanoregula TaxID=2649730 RepID=UPI0009CAB602|nr:MULTISPECIES: hypothetical protein [unclassified Methanoregula]OPX65330.1 MAG: hypothetical protein A4E33_00363 [Methanoregula sp. PtaB.Bin085]OPY32239.1 MAG: hypothetical protein A4E34_02613 [Methanoregula sp. PtaU1.Bin006]